MANEYFWKLLAPEHSEAQRFCRRLTGSIDGGDDLYMDGLVTALQKFQSLKDPQAFRSWLYRILINRYKNDCRFSRRHPHEALDEEAISRYTHDPADELTVRRWLERAYRALKPDEKALVVLHELEGWTVRELAGALKVREGTVKARLSRSRRRMRHAIERILSDENERSLTGKANYVVPKNHK